ncbi:MAG: Clp protease ClpP [Rikenellaceae bacterium]
MEQKIKITNKQDVVTIDIEGAIGVPEEWQFEDPQQRVATYEKFRGVVSEIQAIQAAEVVVNIRSTGGDVGDALLIYEALTSLSAKVTTKAYGYVASAATVIAQAASQGCREISPNCLYLIHNSSCSVDGNAAEILAKAQLLQQTDQRLAELYATRSGGDSATYSELMAEQNGDGRWLSPSEVMDYKLADTIIAEIHNSNKKDSMIKNIYRKVCQVLNIAPDNEEEVEVQDDHLQQLDEALESSEQREQQLQEQLAAEQTARETAETKLVEVENRATTAETEFARFKAKATQTKEIEDPTINNDQQLTPNQSAYKDDAQKFNR